MRSIEKQRFKMNKFRFGETFKFSPDHFKMNAERVSHSVLCPLESFAREMKFFVHFSEKQEYRNCTRHYFKLIRVSVIQENYVIDKIYFAEGNFKIFTSSSFFCFFCNCLKLISVKCKHSVQGSSIIHFIQLEIEQPNLKSLMLRELCE